MMHWRMHFGKPFPYMTTYAHWNITEKVGLKPTMMVRKAPLQKYTVYAVCFKGDRPKKMLD